MTDVAITCNAAEPFDAFTLRDWLAREVAAGRVPATGEVTLHVRHPDREGEGSCRWCGARANEMHAIRDGRLT